MTKDKFFLILLIQSLSKHNNKSFVEVEKQRQWYLSAWLYSKIGTLGVPWNVTEMNIIICFAVQAKWFG